MKMMSALITGALGVCAALAILAGCGTLRLTSPLPAQLTNGISAGHRTGYKVLFSFNETDGAYPGSALTALSGTLYGTTYSGGANHLGTVFQITTSGTESLLYTFKGGTDGASPEAGLTVLNGTLYGTTYGGGSSSYGTIFKITTAGSESVIYSFKGTPDGEGPHAGLTALNGALYGTTEFGGTTCPDYGSLGCGTVFKVTSSGIESVLYSFKGTPDGEGPYAGLTELRGSLYGTTVLGGLGVGTVFAASTSGTENVLYSFKGAPDGAEPFAGLTVLSSTLYGTTPVGGTSGYGTVFAVSTSGTETVPYSFKGGKDGEGPSAPVIAVKGALYGTTDSGGDSECTCGTVFETNVSGTEHVLYAFKGNPDGANPFGGLTLLNRKLYGTTDVGGYGDGTVFSISP